MRRVRRSKRWCRSEWFALGASSRAGSHPGPLPFRQGEGAPSAVLGGATAQLISAIPQEPESNLRLFCFASSVISGIRGVHDESARSVRALSPSPRPSPVNRHSGTPDSSGRNQRSRSFGCRMNPAVLNDGPWAALTSTLQTRIGAMSLPLCACVLDCASPLALSHRPADPSQSAPDRSGAQSKTWRPKDGSWNARTCSERTHIGAMNRAGAPVSDPAQLD